MTLKPVTLIKGDGIDASLDYSDKLPKNMYAVQKDVLGASGYMTCFPGLTKFADVVGKDRGGFYNELQEEHFRVSGEKLISVSEDGVTTELGTIRGEEQVTIKELYSPNTQGIVANRKLYLYNVADGLLSLSCGAIDGVFVDGYYLLTDGTYLFHTKISDETSIEPLAYASAEFSPDRIVGLEKTQDNKVVVFGRFSIEYFINKATDNFAFGPLTGRSQKIGLVATHAKVQSKANIYIVGGRRNESLGIHLVTIGTSKKISTKEIDKILEGYLEEELEDVRMELLSDKNETLILVHLPHETLCFNESVAERQGLEQAWSTLNTGVHLYWTWLNPNTTDFNYRGINGVLDPRNGKRIYGDKSVPYVGYLDYTTFSQYGELQEWILYTPFVELEAASLDALSVKIMPGHYIEGTVAVSLTYNGVSYGTEHWTSYGKRGNYRSEFTIRRLGYIENWIGFKLRGATTEKMAFALMVLDYE